jgi:hypothetical protein
VERFHSPIAGGLQPAGKGCAPSPTAVIRPRLPGAGAESRLPRGRQARPDLTRVKSGKKERARHATAESSEPHHASARRQGVCPKPNGGKTAAPRARPAGRRGRRGSTPACRRTNPARRKGRTMRRPSHRSLITLCRGRGGGAGATAGVGGDDL